MDQGDADALVVLRGLDQQSPHLTVRRINKTEYKPEGNSEGYEYNSLKAETRYNVQAYCLDPDKYGAANPEGTDFYQAGLSWVRLTWEFLRGGTDEATAPYEDHLLGYDAETGFWHPVDPNVRDRIALDYTMQYSDVSITTDLLFSIDEDEE